ncbi:MAG: DUF4270 domain-containing protein [Muribaculaceae bacterium]|nr:DUF4270 domain-containing protein [Muribaculaceae bacterium]
MKISKLAILAPIAAMVAATSCEEVSPLGNSLVEDQIQIVMDSSFTATGKTVDIGNVASMTATQLLGSIDAENYGKLTSDFVAQFMPAQSLETEGVSTETIDSIKLVMTIPLEGFVGDSLTPMGLDVFKLSKQLTSPIYSDFDPTGYYSKSDLIASKVYNATVLSRSDSIAKLKYRTVDVMLPRSFGQQLFQKYLDSPETYADPVTFAQYFPGIYVANSYGSGRIMKVAETKMQMFYRKLLKVDDKDTTIYANANYFAVTPEVLSNNNMSLTLEQNILDLEAQGKLLVVAPIGKEVELTFPTDKILEKYNELPKSVRVVNSLTFIIPAQTIANDYEIKPPAYLLMVLKSKKDEFFASRSINDDKTSFYATYDASTHSYTFSELRNYIRDMINKGTVSPEDMEFVITPVSVTTETVSGSYSSSTTYTTAICPYVEQPAMAILDLEKAKIKFSFTRQSAAF